MHASKQQHLPKIDDFQRIVIKVGSSSLIDSEQGAVKSLWLEALVEDVAELHQSGKEILIVSSGAIALGRTLLKLPDGTLKLADSQASAAIGQIALARIWAQVLDKKEIRAGQVLLTLGDTEERRRYLNARATLNRLLDWRAIPIINENDTVATSEIRYGDNDRLAARVATMASADLLILLSDITGLYSAPPRNDPNAAIIPYVTHIDAAIEAMAGGAGSNVSRGGMITKIEAAKIATTGGAHMIIADGRPMHPLRNISQGEPCTWFLTPSNPIAARKKWIAGQLEPRGAIFIDAGAVQALAQGKSLLPAGVTRIEGEFSRGDCVIIRSPLGSELGRGLIAYDSIGARLLIGRNSKEIEKVLGVPGRAELLHRDDLVMAKAIVAGSITSK